MDNCDEEFRSLNVIPHLKRLEEKKEKGRGSYGAVYEVSLENDTPAIAKRLHKIFLEVGYSAKGKQNMIRKFKLECIMLNKLDHPNIVAFLGVHIGPHGEEDGDICLVMESLHFDLDKCMDDTSIELSHVRKMCILRDVACGLEHLHFKNIGHRDLTSRNVLLTYDLMIAKIADFGCSKLFDSWHEVHTICPGTADYMPPEAKQDYPKYKFELDCFSFGHLSLYLWNRERPTLDDNSISVEDVEKHQIQVGKRRRALLRIQRRHSKLKEFLVKCLSDIPANRPSSKDIYSFFKNAAGECLFEHVAIDEIQQKPASTVISIAFGATTLKVAYRMEGREIIHLPIQEEYRDPFVPAVLLLRKHSEQIEMEIGRKAQDQFYNMTVDLNNTVFFKLSKEHIMDFHLSKTIKGSDDEDYFLVEVLGAILFKLKQIVKNYLSVRYNIHDFHWVIAVWDLKASAMFKSAASLAGYYSESDSAAAFSLRPFRNSCFDPFAINIMVQSDRVSVVSKSESAAVWYSELHSSVACSPADSCYLSVFVGGQTTAITVFQVNDNRVIFLNPTHTELCGGATVNETFLQFLAECIVHDENFSSYIKHPPDMLHLLGLGALHDEDLELMKREFAGSDPTDCYSLKLPLSFFKFYGKQFKSDDEVQLFERSLVLQISSTKFKQIMDTCLSSIIYAIDKCIGATGKRLDAIFLFGGFGGCPYVSQKIRSNYKETVTVETPSDCSFASAYGGCLYSSNPPLRISHATYGIICCVPYESQMANHVEKSLNSKDEDVFCHQSKFYAIVRKGELINCNCLKLHKLELTPLYCEKCVVKVGLYSTKDDMRFTFDMENDHGPTLEEVTCLASIRVHVQAGIGETSPPLELSVEFGTTEVTISTHCYMYGRIAETVVY